jgi:hypothetical protein
MTMEHQDEYHDMIAVAKAYFQAFATAADVEEQLSPEVEFYFARFGVGQGAEAYARLARGLSDYWDLVDFDIDNFSYIAAGANVVVEGTVSGKLPGGVSFRGHRFCAVLEVKQNLITRMYFYTDPDMAAQQPSPVTWQA